MILPGYIGCIKRAGSTLHWVAKLDVTAECIYRVRTVPARMMESGDELLNYFRINLEIKMMSF